MIILPIGNMVFYIQPVYLTAATRLKIPQLQRLIISQGSMVAMDVSLEEAFKQIEERVSDTGSPPTPPPSVGPTPEAAPEQQEPEKNEPAKPEGESGPAGDEKQQTDPNLNPAG
jgi:uncharacterized membrane protein (UPF0182 family)